MKTTTILIPIKTTAAKTVFSAVVFCLFFGMLTNTVLGIGDNAFQNKIIPKQPSLQSCFF